LHSASIVHAMSIWRKLTALVRPVSVLVGNALSVVLAPPFTATVPSSLRHLLDAEGVWN
jgi:hypothetical protein